MEQIQGYEGLYEIHLVGTPDGQPGVWSVRKKMYLRKNIDTPGYQSVLLPAINGKRKRFRIHRLVMEHFINNIDNYPEVDHIDRNKKNNILSNLRWITCSQNKINRNNKGYDFCKSMKKYRVRIQKDKKRIDIGFFDTEEEARNAYIEASKIYYPNILV